MNDPITTLIEWACIAVLFIALPLLLGWCFLRVFNIV